MVACDVCVNNLLPLANTKLLRDYSRVDPRVGQLVRFPPRRCET
jgi:DNA polymerase sigma